MTIRRLGPERWAASSLAEIEAKGQADGIRVGDRAWIEDTKQHYVCTAFGNPRTGDSGSTWEAVGVPGGPSGAGNLLYGGSSLTWSQLGPSSDGSVLSLSGGFPVWSTPLVTSGSPGDMLYWGGSDYSKLGIGASGQVLQSNGSVPAWADQRVPLGSAAGEILYWDGSEWVVLAPGVANYTLRMNAAGTAPEWWKGVMPGSATGDILYWNGSAWANLGVGASGEVLTSNGTTPQWSAPSGGGGGWTIVDVQTTPKVISNTTTHTNIYNHTFAAGDLTGTVARLRITGTYLNYVWSTTGRLRVILGGETILDILLSFSASSLRRAFMIELEIHAIDATTHRGGGFYAFAYPDGATVGHAAGSNYNRSPMSFIEPSTVDSDAASTQLQVTWVHGTASPNLELRAETAILEQATIPP